jgi:hypothetical protein
MAEKKNNKKSGFDAPVKGEQYPKGTFKKGKDGLLVNVKNKK